MTGTIKRAWARWLPLIGFRGSQQYWRTRYRKGGDSGSGSGGEAAQYKARVLNRFVDDERIASVVEFGCGDGRQLELANYPAYLGIDISPEAISICRQKFAGDATRSFSLAGEARDPRADLALSLDVVFHLVEDDVYFAYLDQLFAAAGRFVAIYSTDGELGRATLPHVRHRHVAADIELRFAAFDRMRDFEATLDPPVEFSRGLPSRFLFYRRRV